VGPQPFSIEKANPWHLRGLLQPGASGDYDTAVRLNSKVPGRS
jgi:hypothetical protein